MKEIRDTQKIEEWLHVNHIADHFRSSDLHFQAFCYEKGEFLTVPTPSLDKILFLVEGTAQIYRIRDNGNQAIIGHLSGFTILGDLEFCHLKNMYYTEAKTRVICLSLSIEKYRTLLENDPPFLLMLLHSIADKLNHLSSLAVSAPSIEERVLLYMNQAPATTLKGVETALSHLHCSRRQLLRILKKLLDEGKIEKIRKGQYRLTAEDDSM